MIFTGDLHDVSRANRNPDSPGFTIYRDISQIYLPPRISVNQGFTLPSFRDGLYCMYAIRFIRFWRNE